MNESEMSSSSNKRPAQALKTNTQENLTREPKLARLECHHSLPPLAQQTTNSVGDSQTSSGDATLTRIQQVFPNAVTNKDLVNRVTDTLSNYGYDRETSILATSLCCDELARPLENDFANVYGQQFSMGGLAAFPFAGVTGFGAMAHHIPDDGSCLVVYGPHIGVDSSGVVGSVERRGRIHGGACCGSAAAAAGYVLKVHKGEMEAATATIDPLDYQQAYVGSILLPHADRLANAKDSYVELPMCLFDAQKEMMGAILAKGASEVATGKIALVGGVQINTPAGMSDYFLPLQFDLFDNKGNLVKNLLEAL